MPDLEVNIAGNRERLRKLGEELIEACDSPNLVDLQVYGEYNGRDFGEVTVNFSNDDMEADVNPDIQQGIVLVDVESR